jgi:amino acid transporter
MDCRIIKKTEKMKKYITTVSFAKIAVFIFILFTSITNAQTALPDAPDDTTSGAPIDDYIIPLAIVGIILVFIRFKAIQAKKIKRQNRQY